ncbi:MULTISPECIES: DUF4272 domain-containing protein [Xanthomonas]|uniref:DUF4272 domain-containing protein n=2 Tax=Xanthomonas TaxID=338 RepID=UPI0006E4BF21|nr:MULTISPECIES: DUF4272 domain-containing protein [Xanthomonas]MBO9747702.1 DUF4272 domain-containing protein [Xanthomonas phaseoli pv. dieffenbachiae]MBO9750905.1 DUF4272 domain-containing protein [Xanthomonas phaseoli pv. dieffenbachiae]MBO9879172.1 DUF4272 domain-containing protein [Xanthomonas sp. D-99]MBO9890023.1 DUF4272 domain-containing protein [Xanthomonas sp. D-36-1]OQP77154.1 hypothetical protein IB69_010045 [Xanthomonas citri]
MSLLVNAYSTLRTPLWPDFLPQAAVQHRDHADPALVDHLHGFVGYVNQAGDGQMTQSRYHLMRHVQRVRQHFSFQVDDADFGALAQWAEQANAVCFLADGSVRDPHGRVLISQGEPAIDDDAQVPYPPDALQRRAQQSSLLTAQGIRVPPSLPPVPGEAEARVRDAAVVSRRMLALFAVALRAEILATGDTPPSLDEVETRLPGVAAALSPQERAFFAQAAPDAQALANFGWRYEALAAQRALDNAQAAERTTLARRPLPELLDTLDRHLRLHWAVRQAGRSGQPLPAGIVPGVVYERHYALNWLLHFEDAEWDEVETPT